MSVTRSRSDEAQASAGGSARSVALAVALALIHLALGWFFFAVFVPGLRQEAISEWRGRLAAMADDRRAAIESWVGDRLADARVVASYPSVSALLNNPLADRGRTPSGEGTSAHLSKVLDGVARAYRYRSIAVVRPGGEVMARSSDADSLGRAVVGFAQRATAAGTSLIDLWMEDDGSVVIGVATPVLGAGTRPDRIGAVVLIASPQTWLYPFLEMEPSLSRTRETLLVRKDDGHVVYLSPLRHDPAAPLTLRRSIDTPGLAARAALEGNGGFGSFVDYRGAAVFAATRRIRNAPWALVVKADRGETLAAVHRETRTAGVAGAALLVAIWALAFGLWRDRRARYERAVTGAETRFGALLEQARDIVLFVDPEGRILDCNQAALQAYGYDRKDLLSLGLADLRTEDARATLADDLRRAATPEGFRRETVHRRKDGTTFPVEMSARGVEMGDATVIVGVARDISPRMEAEARIRRLNRLLRTISEINQLIVRESSSERLLREACRIAVDQAGFAMAWIGLTEAGTGAVKPAASAGAAVTSYLAHILVRADESPLGRGPTGTAIRENRTVVAQDWEAEEDLAPWREVARTHGVRSSAALPLRVAGVTVGAVSVYADEPGAFDPETVGLLEELVDDIGYAIGALEGEARREAAEAALRDSEARYRLISRNAGDVIWTLDLSSRRFTFVSPSVQRLRGFSPEQAMDQTLEDAIEPEACRLLAGDLPGRVAAFMAGDESARIRTYEMEEIRLDGTSVPTEVVTTLLTDDRGQVTSLLGVSREITKRRRAETELRKERDRAQMYVDTVQVVLVALDRGGRVTLINSKGCQLLGWSEQELLGRDWFASCIPERECGELRVAFARIMAGEIESLSYVENRVVTRSGEERLIAWHNTELRDASGALVGTLSSGEDITARKRAEQELRRVSTELQTIFDSIPATIWFKNRENRFLRVNRATSELMGMTADEIEGHSAEEILPEFAAQYHRDDLEVITSGRPKRGIIERVRTASGDERWVTTDKIPYRDENGEILGVIAFAVDITERKRAEDALRESEARYRLISENAADVIWAMDVATGRFTYVSPSVFQLLGFTADEVMAQPVVAALTPESYRRVAEHLPQRISAFLGGDESARVTTMEVDQPRRDGSVVATEVVTTLITDEQGRVVELLGVSRDITERKRSERALRESEARFALFMDHLPALVFVKDASSRLLYLNRYMKEFFGFGEVVGRGTEDLFPAPLAAAMVADDRRALAEGLLTAVETATGADGSERVFHTLKFPIERPGQETLVGGIALDITTRKAVEDALQASEERFRRAVIESPLPIILHADDGEILQLSRSWTEITGYTAEEIPTIDVWTERAYGERSGTIRQEIDRLYSVDRSVAEGEFAIRTKSGETRIWDFSSAPLGRLKDGRRVVMSMAMDITERTRMEGEIRRWNLELERRVRERTAALEASNRELEAFSYSVSHDLRTPLRAIDGFAHTLLGDHSSRLDVEGRRLLGEIGAHTRRMTQLIDDLLTLSRATRSPVQRARVDMTSMVTAVFREIVSDPSDRERIAFHVGQLPDAWVDPGLMRQAWFNLIANAVKFTRPRDHPVVEVEGHSEGNVVIYEVRDNGVGFNSRYTHKLFGVFQRLHAAWEFEGTGVGLALVKRIIERHGGEISAAGEVGRGATFTIRIPWDEGNG
ncbi:MAG: PAS domain S-box protein [Acidobacteriota bacterium]